MKLLEQKPYQTEQEEVAYYIERHYLLDDHVNAEDLLNQYADASDMVLSLRDPYSEMLLKEELDQAVDDLNGNYVGAGFEARKKPGEYLKIMAVIPDSPAMKSGLRAEDIILKIEGEDTLEMDSRKTLSLIKGPENTIVSLKVQRDSSVFDVQIQRAVIQDRVVENHMLSESVGYLMLSRIPLLIHQELEVALEEMKARGMQTLILDLRGNGGGEIEEVSMIASLMVSENEDPLFTVTHKTKETTIYGHTRKQIFSGSLFVLVNEYTASSAELLAEVLRNSANAAVVGERTCGKGISQSFFYLESGNILKLTTGEFSAVQSQRIQGQGIIPDDCISMDPEEEGDIQLNKAVELAFVRKRKVL